MLSIHFKTGISLNKEFPESNLLLDIDPGVYYKPASQFKNQGNLEFFEWTFKVTQSDVILSVPSFNKGFYE